jgi:hypothetical protein
MEGRLLDAPFISSLDSVLDDNAAYMLPVIEHDIAFQSRDANSTDAKRTTRITLEK